jgi:hypothetical protein
MARIHYCRFGDIASKSSVLVDSSGLTKTTNAALFGFHMINSSGAASLRRHFGFHSSGLNATWQRMQSPARLFIFSAFWVPFQRAASTRRSDECSSQQPQCDVRGDKCSSQLLLGSIPAAAVRFWGRATGRSAGLSPAMNAASFFRRTNAAAS